MPRERCNIAIFTHDKKCAHAIRRSLQEERCAQLNLFVAELDKADIVADAAMDLAVVDFDSCGSALIESLDCAGIPFILLVDKVRAEIAFDAFKCGALDVLLKTDEPYDRLCEVVHRSIGSRADAFPQNLGTRTYYEMVETANDAMYAHDTTGRFTFVNRKAEELTGYGRDALLGQHVATILAEDGARTIREHLRKNRRLWWDKRFEITIKSRSGAIIPVELSVSPIIVNRKLAGFEGIARDIRKRIAAREALEQREARIQQLNLEIRKQKMRLEEATRIRSEFVSNISHEFRTPLNGIIGYTDLLLEQVYGGLEDNQKAAIENIRMCAIELLRMVQEVLDLSKINSSQLALERELCAPNDLIEATFGTVTPLAKKKGLHVHAELDDKLPQLYVDFQRIYEVFVNLAGNAVKFTEQGSVEIGAYSDGSVVTFFVRDTGIGIPRETRETIFQEFRQGDSSLGRLHGGIGLGLSLSRRLIELHGGSIEVESDADKGSTFTFTIPLQQNRILEAKQDTVVHIYNKAPWYHE